MNALQIFLLLNVFVLGIAATIAIQHAYTHYLHKRYPEKDHAALKDSPLPDKLKERLLKEARNNFQDTLDASADSLRHDLKATSDRISLHLEELSNDITHKEAERYREQLTQLYTQAEKDISGATESISQFKNEHTQQLQTLHTQAETTITTAGQDIEDYKQALKNKLDELYEQANTSITDVNAEITEHTQQLKQELSQEVEAEKQQLIEQFETKLNDAVVAFLLETLRHNVDLGAQGDYLTATLEEHKSELVEGLKHEA